MTLGLLVLIATTGASPGAPLGLEEVLASVERHHPLLVAAVADRRSAEGELLAARGGFDPTWKSRGLLVPFGPYPSEYLETLLEQPTPFLGTRLFASYRLGDGPFPVYDEKLETNRYGEVRAGVQVPLWRDRAIDRRRAALTRAGLGARIAELGLEQQRLELHRAAALRYWDWVAAGGRLGVARALHRAALDREAQIAARVRAGDLPAYELGENQRAVLQREALLRAAERGLEQAEIELSLFHRDAGGRPLRPPASRLPSGLPPEGAPLAVVQDEEARALDRRPDVRRLRAAREQAEVEVTLAGNQRRPAVDLVVAGAQDLGPGDPKRGKAELEVQLLLDVPLLLRAQEGRLQASEAGVGRVEAQLRFARERAIAEVRDARSAVDRARERAAASRRERELAHQLAAGELQRFLLGESTLFVVNLREQTAVEAELRLIDALADYHKAAVALRVAGGLPVR